MPEIYLSGGCEVDVLKSPDRVGALGVDARPQGRADREAGGAVRRLVAGGVAAVGQVGAASGGAGQQLVGLDARRRYGPREGLGRIDVGGASEGIGEGCRPLGGGEGD